MTARSDFHDHPFFPPAARLLGTAVHVPTPDLAGCSIDPGRPGQRPDDKFGWVQQPLDTLRRRF